jgi:hypothetical protein
MLAKDQARMGEIWVWLHDTEDVRDHRRPMLTLHRSPVLIPPLPPVQGPALIPAAVPSLSADARLDPSQKGLVIATSKGAG